jgi:hypothetical protein
VRRFAYLVSGSAGHLVEGALDPAPVLFASVPYALKAADAETLGGLRRPASAFSRAPASDCSVGSTAEPALASASDTRRIEGIGTATALAKFVTPFEIGESVAFDVNGNVGIGTSGSTTVLLSPYLRRWCSTLQDALSLFHVRAC